MSDYEKKMSIQDRL